jgi:hypothetical protein
VIATDSPPMPRAASQPKIPTSAVPIGNGNKNEIRSASTSGFPAAPPDLPTTAPPTTTSWLPRSPSGQRRKALVDASEQSSVAYVIENRVVVQDSASPPAAAAAAAAPDSPSIAIPTLRSALQTDNPSTGGRSPPRRSVSHAVIASPTSPPTAHKRLFTPGARRGGSFGASGIAVPALNVRKDAINTTSVGTPPKASASPLVRVYCVVCTVWKTLASCDLVCARS